MLVIESCYGRDTADSVIIATMLKAHGVPCEAHCFNNSSLSARKLDPQYFAALLRASSCRVVHVACEALRSGGDLVLEWDSKAMQLDVESVRDMLLTSVSHSELFSAGDKASHVSRREGVAGSAQLHDASRGSGESEDEDFGVRVDPSQAFAGCTSRIARKVRREASRGEACEMHGVEVDLFDEEWHRAEAEKERQLIGDAHAQKAMEPFEPSGFAKWQNSGGLIGGFEHGAERPHSQSQNSQGDAAWGPSGGVGVAETDVNTLGAPGEEFSGLAEQHKRVVDMLSRHRSVCISHQCAQYPGTFCGSRAA